MDSTNDAREERPPDAHLRLVMQALLSIQRQPPSVLEQQTIAGLDGTARFTASVSELHPVSRQESLSSHLQSLTPWDQLMQMIMSNPDLLRAAFQTRGAFALDVDTNSRQPTIPASNSDFLSQLSRSLLQHQALQQLHQQQQQHQQLMVTAARMHPLWPQLYPGLETPQRSIAPELLQLMQPHYGLSLQQAASLRLYSSLNSEQPEANKSNPRSTSSDAASDRATKRPRQGNYPQTAQQRHSVTDSHETTTSDDRQTAEQSSHKAGGDSSGASIDRRYRMDSFPVKLLELIQEAKKDGLEHLISFTKDGTAVQTSSPYDLEEYLFPKFFRHQNYASFKRQLSMYNFQRVLEGENKGAFAHPLFLEGCPELVEQIKRSTDVKAPRKAPPSEERQEP